MKTVLIESHYLPSIAYFAVLQNADVVCLEKHENYIKQTYRNRTYINTTQGKEMLTIPLTSKHGKVKISEVRIDHSKKWQNNHWRAIQSAYGNAPFFEFYAEELHRVLYTSHEFLFDLNLELLSLCLKWLQCKMVVQESMAYINRYETNIIDLRNQINAKNNEGSNKFYKSVPYVQVFGNKFVNNLSLVDLIFCVGPDARQVVQTSSVEH